MKYKLELNEEQAATLIRALDLYSRIGMGQFKEILDWQFEWDRKGMVARFLEKMDCSYEAEESDSYFYSRALEYLEGMLDTIKEVLTGLELNAYRGIFGKDTPECCKVAWDIQQVVRNCQAWANHPNGGWTVNFDEPLVGSKQPLPECEAHGSPGTGQVCGNANDCTRAKGHTGKHANLYTGKRW